MSSRRRLMGLAGAFLLSAALAEAAPFTNGSFEISALNPGAGFITLATGNTQITGWEVFGGSTIDYIGTFWQAAEGTRSVDLNGNAGAAGVRQTFDTVAGTTYEVLFAMAGNPDGPPPLKGLTVSAGGAPVEYVFDATGATRAAMGWLDYSFVFVAGGNFTTLSFLSSTGGAFYGPALDNVRVSAVPEPAVVSLLAAGLLAGAARRRSRRAN